MRTWLALSLLVASTTAIPNASPSRPQDLERRVAELEALNRELTSRLRGEGRPINLGRTRLASVSASSVNGRRSLADPYYGIRNAFDDGDHRIGDIQYSYWMSGNEARPWIEVRFEEPVVVESIAADIGSRFPAMGAAVGYPGLAERKEGSASFRAKVLYVGGGEENFPPSEEKLDLEEPRAGVVGVRLTFEQTLLKVHDVRVMGHAPRGEPVEATLPRLELNATEALVTAREHFARWSKELLETSSEDIEETAEGGWNVVFLQGRTLLLRVGIDSRGEATVEPGVELQPVQR